MSFSSLVANVTATVQNTFSDFSVTVNPQSGGMPYTIQCVTKNPALEEDYVPGSSTGTTNLLLFVQWAGLPVSPARGDTATVDSVNYDIFQIDVDREGGATLRLRRRNTAIP